VGVQLPGGGDASALSVLGSLLSSSLPPRAQKRRRGSRFRIDEPAAAAEGDAAASASAAAASAAPARPAAGGSGSSGNPSDASRPWRARQFEYLDHTADIQLHSWGASLEEALEQVVLAMFAYMTDLTRVEIDPAATESFEVSGHDLDSLLFNLLDEFLFRFLTNEWVVRDIRVDALDRARFRVKVTGFGERFTLDKHTQGTEVKAITYSNMQIFEHGKRVQSDNDQAAQEAQEQRAADDAASGTPAAGDEVSPPPEAHVLARGQSGGSGDDAAASGQHAAEIYVIVDI